MLENEDLFIDVLYIDAPWGGKDYKNKERLSLYLDKNELSDIYNKFKKKTKLFVFKLPKNYFDNINNENFICELPKIKLNLK